jgi:hypothetical protein
MLAATDFVVSALFGKSAKACRKLSFDCFLRVADAAREQLHAAWFAAAATSSVDDGERLLVEHKGVLDVNVVDPASGVTALAWVVRARPCRLFAYSAKR